jgi:tRNA (Thr-GGU) A37 N-methylase
MLRQKLGKSVHLSMLLKWLFMNRSQLTHYWCRNGTPRQPLLVPLARACLVFDSARVPPASLEGLVEYSHCWIIYVFHLNTDLVKLWKHPSRSKFKAKVTVATRYIV